MKTTIAKSLFSIIIIISYIVLFFSHNELAVSISAFILVLGMIVLLITIIDTAGGDGK